MAIHAPYKGIGREAVSARYAVAEDTLAARRINSDLVLPGEPVGTLASVLDQHGIRHLRITDLDGEPVPEPVELAETDTALAQLTSGSTAELRSTSADRGRPERRCHGVLADRLPRHGDGGVPGSDPITAETRQ